jgi:hypothetical protein
MKMRDGMHHTLFKAIADVNVTEDSGRLRQNCNSKNRRNDLYFLPVRPNSQREHAEKFQLVCFTDAVLTVPEMNSPFKI